MTAQLRQWAALAAGAVLALPAPAAAQQVHPGETRGLGLTGPDIPELLKTIAADPYKAPAAPACQTIPAELLALDQVLGADADDPPPKKSEVSAYAGRMAGDAVRGLVPYRGAIRFVTGADRKDHRLMEAARAGWARRGFLRGLEANLTCAPAPHLVAADAAAGTEQPAAGTPALAPVATLDAAKLTAAYQPPAAPDLRAITLTDPLQPGVDGPGR